MVVRAWLLLLLLGLAGCGGERAAPRSPEEPDPLAEAVAWLEGERDCQESRRWLAGAAFGELLAMDPEAVQERLTECLRAALAGADLDTAEACLEGLVEHFDGQGRRDDRLFSADAMRETVREAAVGAARRGRFENATTSDLGLARYDGGRVVVWADDWLLGEARLLGVLGRWARDGRSGGLRVGVVPILRGSVRVGIRRQLADTAEELASITERLEETPIVVEPMPLDAAEALERFGLGRGEGAIIVVTRDGHIVKRLAGPLDDLAPLEGWVQKAGSR